MDILFFLQDAGTPPAGGAQQQPGGILTMLPMFALMFVVMYFLMIRPQNKQRKQREEMISNLKKNDHVQTSSGIYGIIKQIKPDDPYLILCIDERKDVCIKVSKSSVVSLEKASGAPVEGEAKPETTEKKS
ncbi:MAG: preprotein translocase subunit YajC [Planctomycetota bacterium]|nr:MAG: preprotein translocase subunit YajC [Planctomycetota bacterium]